MKNILWFSDGNLIARKSNMVFGLFFFRNNLLIKSIILLFVINISCKKTEEVKDNESMPKKWEALFPAVIYYSSPALSSDEKYVYIGTSSGLFGNHQTNQVFAAIEASTGKESWRLNIGINEVRSSPVIASDGSIYFSVETRNQINGTVSGDELWHVSSEGSLLWKFNINPDNFTMEVGQSVPALGSDGSIYVAGNKLYAINPDGTLRWTIFGSTNEALRNAPVIGADGTIYFVYHNIPLTAINPEDGSVKWTCTLGVNDHCFASPAIGADGRIYVATQPGLLYAVSSDGQPLWTFDLLSVGFSGTFRSSPAVDADGTIFLGINTGNPSSAFFAINSDGTLKWKFEPSDLPEDVPSTHFDIYSSPALGSDGAVYFGQEFGRVYCLNKTDGSFIGMSLTNSGITWSSPAIDSKGVLYISDLSGRLYAFQTASSGLDPLAAWPKFRFDNFNRGQIQKPSD